MASAAESLERSLKIFQKPMCLISTTADGNLKLEEEPLKEIERIDMPLVVVAITGLYRTGKSYLMNRLAGETQGFPVGYTTESKTKGIWAWCKIHPKKSDQVLLLLDTEGLGDIKKGDKDHDNKIFTIATLLCNVLVYNIMTAFNQDAVENLTFITEMSKHITFSSGGKQTDEKFGLILPIFVLCVRDFTLKMKMKPDKYLKDCLKLKHGKGKEIVKFNRPRECIRRYFPKRKCFTFDVPGNRSVLQRLETASAEELSEDFREETEKFLNYVYSCKPKTLLSSKFLQGTTFVTLATSYISAIGNGAIPDVDDAIQTVAEVENERIANAAVEEFQIKLKTMQLPVFHIQDFDKLYEDIQNASLANFRSEAMFESGRYEKRAIDKMDKIWIQFKKQNCELIKRYCMTKLKRIYGEIVGEKKGSGKYFVPGGFKEYTEDILKVKRQYRNEMREIEGYEVTESLNEFFEGETGYESEVLMEAKKHSEEQRKREIENRMKEIQKAQTEQQKLFEKKMAEEKQRAEEHYKKLESERDAYIKRENEKAQLLLQEWADQKQLSEQQIEMMKIENKEQREVFQEEIRQLIEANSKKEKENMERSDRLLVQERQYNKAQTDKMNERVQNIIELEHNWFEEYRNVMQNTTKELEKEKRKNEELKNRNFFERLFNLN